MAAVLAKVQKEVGADAKILSAQRVRSGGMLGFFQKEKFEVIVDMDAKQAPSTTAAPPAPPAQTAPNPFDMPAVSGAKDEEPFTPASLLELAEEISRSEKTASTGEEAPRPAISAPAPPSAQPGRTPEPHISTESDTFAEVLSRMAFQADMRSDPKPFTPPPVREDEDDDDEDNPYVDDYVPEDDEIEGEIIDVPPAAVFPKIEDRPAFLDAPPTREPEPEPEPEPSAVKRRVPIVEEAAEPDEVVEDEEYDEPEPVDDDSPIDEVEPEDEDEPVDDDYDEPEASPVVAERSAPLLPILKPNAGVVPPFRTRVTDHPLANLGLPVAYIPKTTDPEELQRELTMSLERLPKPPEVRPSKGSVIAVVGEFDEALELARDLARQWGRPVEEVVIASARYKGKGAAKALRDIQSAEDARRSWSRRTRPTIVVIDVHPGSKEVAWGEHILTALEPIATFGVADATRKAEDIAAWASQLGGVDCLAVNHLEETVSPASVLGTGIPVERIDGRKATPTYWAMLLTERLTAA